MKLDILNETGKSSMNPVALYGLGMLGGGLMLAVVQQAPKVSNKVTELAKGLFGKLGKH